MDQKIQKISSVMQKAELLIQEELADSPEDAVLIASGLLAVTRNLYVQTLGIDGAVKMFEAVADSFVITEQFLEQIKPTLH
mgnify:FL=1|tara:strand:+ start:717 stop:959 length:243 start_codon:yes stop_codon:yes gene_type:complete